MGMFRRGAPIRTLVEEFCDVMRRRSHGTAKAARTDANRLRAAVGMLGAGYVEDIAPAAVAAMLNAKEAEGCSPKTVNGYREIVQRFCGYAVAEKGMAFRETGKTNPVALIPRRREQAPTITFLEPEQQKTLIDGLAGQPRIRVMVATLIYAGLRRGELVWLTKRDVDMDGRLIHVRAKEIDGVCWQPKTAVNRAVRVFTPLAEELTLWESPSGSPWRFPSPEGRRWNEDNFSKALARAQAPLGTKWTCLDFRHTFGTMLARHGLSDFQIAVLMGNSPGVVRRHYAALGGQDIPGDIAW